MAKKVRLINNGKNQVLDTSTDEYRQLYEEGRIYSQDDTGDLFGGELEEVVVSPVPSNRVERLRAEKLEQITKESYLENQVPAWGKWHDTSPDNMGAYEKSYQNFIDKQIAKQLLEDNPFEGRYPGAKKTQQDRRDWYNSFTPEERELIQRYSSTSRTFGPAISQHNKDEKVRKDSEYGVFGGFFKKEGLRAKAAAASDNLRMGMNKQGWGRTFEDFVNMPAYTASVGGRTTLIPTNIAEGNYIEAAMPLGEAALLTMGVKGVENAVANMLLPVAHGGTAVSKESSVSKLTSAVKTLSEVRVKVKKGEVTVNLPLPHGAALKKKAVFSKPTGQPLTKAELDGLTERAVDLVEAYMFKETHGVDGLGWSIAKDNWFQDRFYDKVNQVLLSGGEKEGIKHATRLPFDKLKNTVKTPDLETVLADPMFKEKYLTAYGFHSSGEAVAFPTEIVKVTGEKRFRVSLEKPKEKGFLPRFNIEKRPDRIDVHSKYRTKEELFHTITHELGHEAQGVENWGDVISKFSDDLNYWVANENTKVGKMMGDAMVEGVHWRSAPIELHADLFAERIKAAHGLSSDPKIAIQKMYDNIDAIDRQIIESGKLDRFFKGTTGKNKRLKIVNMLPSAIPTAAALEAMANQQKD